MENKTILLISPEAWGTNFVSKHHYANYLAKHNTVYFLNPVTNSTINPLGRVKVNTNNINKNLVQVNYQNLLPRLNSLPKFIQKYIYKKQAQQIQKALNIVKFDIVWSFDPFRFCNQKVWCSDKTIYHTVDFHPKSKYESEIITSSSITFSISKHIPSKHITNKNNIQIINHGFDNIHVVNDGINIPGENIIKAVYVGNVGNLLDKNRLNKLAINYPKIDFILIGPSSNSNLSIISNKDNITYPNNVFLLGEIKASLIDLYLKKCDINLLILKKREGIQNINSHKLMHYFYSGNITISDFLLDYKNNSILNMAQTEQDYNVLFSEVIKNLNNYNSNELKEKRKQFAISNSYDKKIEEISKLLYSK